MRFSQWSIGRQLLAIGLLLAFTLGWWFVVKTAVHAMPFSWVLLIFCAGGGLAIGTVLGERTTIKALLRSGKLQPGWDDDASVDPF